MFKIPFMLKKKQAPGTVEKALQVNLDEQIYGTIAEIGAGQEVARNFFIAGGAAGTIAKTMSAYDMQVSDAIYGQEKDHRYVSLSRLHKMVDREFGLVVERLSNVREEHTTYFAFADTVAAKSYNSDRDCHGWMGIKYQTSPMASPSKVVLHVRMKDHSNVEQQQALGVLGVNLIFGAFYLKESPEKLIESLLDNLSTERIEIDMIKFEGQYFSEIDNRLMSLHLVRSGITHAVFFTNEGEPVQASDLLYKKDILVRRGSFRPVTKVHPDIIRCALKKLKSEAETEAEPIVLTEISMSHLLAFGDLDKSDFLGRVDTLCAMGYQVQISDFTHFYELKDHLKQITRGNISLAVGIKNINEIFTPDNYTKLPGGMIEGLGKLFSGSTRLFVYPKLLKTDEIRVLDEMVFEQDIEYLFRHFMINNKMVSLKDYNPGLLEIFTRDIRSEMADNSTDWMHKVPEQVSSLIRKKGLFGYRS